MSPITHRRRLSVDGPMILSGAAVPPPPAQRRSRCAAAEAAHPAATAIKRDRTP